jgi:hypothetical protein
MARQIAVGKLAGMNLLDVSAAPMFAVSGTTCMHRFIALQLSVFFTRSPYPIRVSSCVSVESNAEHPTLYCQPNAHTYINLVAADAPAVSGPAMVLRSRAAMQSHAAQQLRQARSSGRRSDWQASNALQQRLYHTRRLAKHEDPLQVNSLVA